MLLDKKFYGDMRVENEVIALRKAGYDIVVFCYEFSGEGHVDDFHGAKIVHIPVSLKLIRKLRALTNTVINYYPYFITGKIKRLIKKYNICVFHVHDLYLFDVGLILRKKYFPELKLVGDLHENYVEGLKHYRFANSFPGNLLISIPKWEKSEVDWCLKYDHLITVIDEAVVRYSSLGIPREKLNVVANYVNRDEFLSAETDQKILDKFKGKFVISYIGGFDVHRGLASVIKAVAIVKERIPNIHFVLVGRGAIEPELKQLAKNLGCADNVSFEGFQSPKYLPSYIMGSDVCLIPHLKTVHTDNTIPHKLFHYMLMEKPVLASNCNPIERIIKDAKAGEIYTSDNENELAEKLYSLYSSEEQRTEMGINGKKAVINKYNWESTAENLINLYKQEFSKGE